MQMRVFGAGVAAMLAVWGCDTLESDGGPAAAEAESEAPALDPALAAHPPEGASIELAERGRELFPSCGVCHGMEGEGTQLGPALDDGEWTHISGAVEEIAGVTRSGIASPRDYPVPMPVLGAADLDAEDLQAVATYVYLLSRSGSPAGDTAAVGDPAAPPR